MQNDLLASIGPWMQSSFALWGPIAVWPAVLLFGEGAAIVAFAFSAQGFITPLNALVFSFLGSFSADLFWYFATMSAIRPWFERLSKKNQQNEEESRAFIGLMNKHPYTLLIILKFLVGVRLLLTIYILTKKKIPFSAYFLCTMLGNLLFVAVLFPIGWFLGKGIGGALSIEKNISGLATLVLIVGISSQILFRVFRGILARYSKKVS